MGTNSVDVATELFSSSLSSSSSNILKLCDGINKFSLEDDNDDEKVASPNNREEVDCEGSEEWEDDIVDWVSIRVSGQMRKATLKILHRATKTMLTIDRVTFMHREVCRMPIKDSTGEESSLEPSDMVEG